MLSLLRLVVHLSEAISSEFCGSPTGSALPVAFLAERSLPGPFAIATALYVHLKQENNDFDRRVILA